jgi:hypothetical protein
VAQSQIEVFSNWGLMAGSHPAIECGAGFLAWPGGSTVFLAHTHRVRKLSITGPVVAIAVMEILRALPQPRVSRSVRAKMTGRYCGGIETIADEKRSVGSRQKIASMT